MKFADRDDKIAGAGEYVLGTLDPRLRVEFEAQLTADAELQAEVYAWQDRLLGLTRRAPPLEPVAHLWPRIEARLAQPAAATQSAQPVASARGAANDPLWHRVRLWQAVSSVAIAASLLLATMLALRAPFASAERYLAILQSPDKSATGWVVEATAGGSVRLVPVGDAATVPPDKALQFWTKPQGAAAPTSLGLVAPGRTTELPAARLPALEARQLFELTLEPATGSPIGRPTGPILYVGSTVRL